MAATKNAPARRAEASLEHDRNEKGHAHDRAPDFGGSNFDEAARFIAVLTGQPAGSARVIFQTFTDGEKPRPDPLAKVIVGTLPECWPELERLSAKGAGIFVTVNEMRGRQRRKADFKCARAIFQEDDTGDAPLPPLDPHIVVETSPGKFHRYWLTKTDDREAWEAIERTLVDRFGSDPNAKDCARVLRLPGTLHQKNRAAPFRVRLVGLSADPPYSWSEIVAAIPPAEQSEAKKRGATFFDRVNDAAMQALDAWVPALFPALTEPDLRESGGGWRVSSAALGRDLEEDLAIHPEGIKDFGVADMGDAREGKRTPIDLVMEYYPAFVADGFDVLSIEEAALWLCEQMAVDPATLGHKAAKVTARELHARIECLELSSEDADDVVRDLARAKLSSIEQDRLQKALAKAAGVTRKAVERGVAEARQAGGSTHHEYAKAFLAHRKSAAGGVAPVGTEGHIYECTPAGVWAGKPPEDFEGEVAELFDGQERCERRTDYLSIAKHAYSLALDEAFFEDAPLGLACPDGFFQMSSDGRVSIVPLAAKHKQRFSIEVSPKRGPMPLFEKFLAETFAPVSGISAEGQHEQIAFVQEIVGSILFGQMARLEKAVLLHGVTRGGKGTLTKIVQAMVPKEHRDALSPFLWNREYYLASLAGKRLNVVGELPEKEPIPAAAFKTVTGRDLLSGRHPTHRPFNFKNEAAHIFSANSLLVTRDQSDAFFVRWLLVDFQNSALGREDETLVERIINGELPQILAWAIDGAVRLAKRGRFQPTAAHERLLAKWRRTTNSVLGFLLDPEACVLERDDLTGRKLSVRRSEWYAAYEQWCVRSGLRAKAQKTAIAELDEPAVAKLGVTCRVRDGYPTVAGCEILPVGDAFDGWK